MISLYFTIILLGMFLFAVILKAALYKCNTYTPANHIHIQNPPTYTPASHIHIQNPPTYNEQLIETPPIYTDIYIVD